MRTKEAQKKGGNRLRRQMRVLLLSYLVFRPAYKGIYSLYLISFPLVIFMANKRRSKAKPINKPKTGNREPATPLCPPCRYTWEGPALLLIGALGLLNYFGILGLSILNWALLEPIIVLILGLLILSGVLHK